jgi:hypothetical protein
LINLLHLKKRQTEWMHNKKKRSERNKAKKERKHTSNMIKKRVTWLENQRIERITETLELNKGNKICFEANKLLNPTIHRPLQLISDAGNSIISPSEWESQITAYYSTFFKRIGAEPINAWSEKPRQLDPKISTAEVTAAINRLNNGKASVPDNIKAELLKYAPEELHREIADMLNNIFERHESLGSIGESDLIALNKPNNKAKIASNTRPIILLNMIRKILSNIILERIYPLVDQYVTIDQSGFR